MDKLIMFHHLRNPHGLDEYDLRRVRLQAADELERLYAIEEKYRGVMNRVISLKKYLDEA